MNYEDRLIPWAYINFESDQSNGSVQNFRTLLVGISDPKKTPAMAVPFKLERILDIEDAKKKFPDNTSEIFKLIADYRDVDKYGDLFAVEINSTKMIDNLKILADKIEGEPFSLIVTANNAVDYLNQWKTTLISRWSPENQTDGVLLTYLSGNASSDVITESTSRILNSQWMMFLPVSGTTETNKFSWCARSAAIIAREISGDPAIPLTAIPIPGIQSDVSFKREIRENFAKNGICTWRTDISGQVFLESMVTTYLKNDVGQSDSSYKFVNTPFILSRLRYDLRSRLLSKYARYRLAPDGTVIRPGKKITTPGAIKGELSLMLRSWENDGFITNAKEASKMLIVEQSGTTKTSVVIKIHPELIKQLRIFDIGIYFK